MAFFVLAFLILFPLAVAGVFLVVRHEKYFPFVVYPAAAVIIASTCLLLTIKIDGTAMLLPAKIAGADIIMLLAELGLACWLSVLAIKQRDILVAVLIVIQTAILIWFHFNAGHALHAEANLFVDLFSVVMGLIVGVVGTLIAVFAVGYMKDLHHHDRHLSDRRPMFFGVIFLFLSAMFGVCFSNNLLWLLFFWEVTTVCSFLMIAYKGDDTSVRNAFWALRWNLLGGVAFLVGIIVLAFTHQVIELDKLLGVPKLAVMLPLALISFAGITKSAQLPFSSWLVGAMVAPTPVSALLHSSTMVKAGVYIVLRFAASLEGTLVGLLVALVGLITFLLGSFICISQDDAKKVLAYSTIANLGLIILCAGIGTYESVWAGILLIVFHAVSKGLLFLCVGSVEHKLHSRSIEDMSGLIVRLPKLAFMMEIGIAGMFLAPFGMLISKWAVLRAVVDFNPVFAIFLIYGSAATLFFWVKWLGKMIIVEKKYENIEKGISCDQMMPMAVLTVLTIAICALFSPFANTFIGPYVFDLYGKGMTLGAGNMAIMAIMLVLIGFFPLAFLDRARGVRVTEPYLAGANTGDAGRSFIDSLGEAKAMSMKNAYMENIFSEQRLMRLGVILTTVFLSVMVIAAGVYLCHG